MSAARVGRLTHRALDLETDLALLHHWVTHPRSAFWMMQDASPDDVRAAYAAVARSAHHHAHLGLHDGQPAFLMERYDPAHDPVGAHLDGRPGDLGMHLLVAPTDRPVRGFTRAVMRHVMATCFADPAVRRVVVEPDVRNTAVQRLNREVGFVEHGVVDLPGKQALLCTCLRRDFERSPS